MSLLLGSRSTGKMAQLMVHAREMAAQGYRVVWLDAKRGPVEWPTPVPVGPREAPVPRWWFDEMAARSGKSRAPLDPTFIEAQRAALDDPGSTFARPVFRPRV